MADKQMEFTLIILNDVIESFEGEKCYLIETKDREAFEDCLEKAKTEAITEGEEMSLERLHKELSNKGVTTYILDITHLSIFE